MDFYLLYAFSLLSVVCLMLASFYTNFPFVWQQRWWCSCCWWWLFFSVLSLVHRFYQKLSYHLKHLKSKQKNEIENRDKNTENNANINTKFSFFSLHKDINIGSITWTNNKKTTIRIKPSTYWAILWTEINGRGNCFAVTTMMMILLWLIKPSASSHRSFRRWRRLTYNKWRKDAFGFNAPMKTGVTMTNHSKLILWPLN